jgi:hypothetical protein
MTGTDEHGSRKDGPAGRGSGGLAGRAGRGVTEPDTHESGTPSAFRARTERGPISGNVRKKRDQADVDNGPRSARSFDRLSAGPRVSPVLTRRIADPFRWQPGLARPLARPGQ